MEAINAVRPRLWTGRYLRGGGLRWSAPTYAWRPLAAWRGEHAGPRHDDHVGDAVQVEQSPPGQVVVLPRCGVVVDEHDDLAVAVGVLQVRDGVDHYFLFDLLKVVRLAGVLD